jgi:hypothetical protein
VAEKIRSIEKSNDLIRNRTRDLPACSIVPQPTTLPRDPTMGMYTVKCHIGTCDIQAPSRVVMAGKLAIRVGWEVMPCSEVDSTDV